MSYRPRYLENMLSGQPEWRSFVVNRIQTAIPRILPPSRAPNSPILVLYTSAGREKVDLIVKHYDMKEYVLAEATVHRSDHSSGCSRYPGKSQVPISLNPAVVDGRLHVHETF